MNSLDPKRYSIAALLAAAAAEPDLVICRECGQVLTDPKSIAAGIGPICADKVGAGTGSDGEDALE